MVLNVKSNVTFLLGNRIKNSRKSLIHIHSLKIPGHTVVCYLTEILFESTYNISIFESLPLADFY